MGEAEIKIFFFKVRLLRRGYQLAGLRVFVLGREVQLAGLRVFELGREVLWGWNTDLLGKDAAQLGCHL